MEEHYSRGTILMCASSLFFALMAACVKWAAATLPSIEIVFFRSALGSLPVAFMIWRQRASWIGVKPKILLLRGVFGFLALICYFYALSNLDLPRAVILNYTSPVLTVILARIIIRETISSRTVGAIVVSFIGLYFLSSPVLNLKPFPVAVGLVSSFFAALAYVMIRFSDAKESAYTIIFYFTVISTMGSAPFVVPVFQVPTAAAWVALIGVAMFSFFGQLTLTNAIRSAPVSYVPTLTANRPFLIFFSLYFLNFEKVWVH
jgi:drug/metabolite transporter (DMT)-like permease